MDVRRPRGELVVDTVSYLSRAEERSEDRAGTIAEGSGAWAWEHDIEVRDGKPGRARGALVDDVTETHSGNRSVFVKGNWVRPACEKEAVGDSWWPPWMRLISSFEAPQPARC